MNTNTICIHHTNNTFYVECYMYETIEDIKNILAKQYDFNDDDLEFYQNDNKLGTNIKIKDLGKKFCNLYIKGSIKPKIPDKKNETKESPSDNNYISKFHEMGFNDNDDIIENLMQKEETKIEDVIVTLLKKKKK